MSRFFRFISSLLIITFLNEQVLLANPDLKAMDFGIQNLFHSSFGLPDDLGSVEDRFVAAHSPATAYLIHDAHANYSAQKNVAKILEHLYSTQPELERVFLEAGAGDESVTFLKPHLVSDAAQKIDTLLRRGMLQGSEAAALLHKNPIALWGVEDMVLYDRALDAYRHVARHRDAAENYLAEIDLGIESIKSLLWNDRLLYVDSQRQKFVRGQMPWLDYGLFLIQQAQAEEMDLSEFPYIKKWQNLKKSESALNLSGLQKEWESALSSMDPTKKIAWAKEGDLRQVLNGMDLKKQLQGLKGFRSELPESIQTPHLREYIQYLDRALEIGARELVAETSLLEQKMIDRHCLTGDERMLWRADRAVERLGEMLRFQISPEEYQVVQTHAPEHEIKNITGFLNRKLMDLETQYDKVTFLKLEHEDCINQAKAFYTLTFERDKHFLAQILTADEHFVLIAGGFHMMHLKQMLKDRGISYVSIVPHVTHETNQKNYEKILLSQDSNHLMPLRHLGYGARNNQGQPTHDFEAIIKDLTGQRSTDITYRKIRKNKAIMSAGNRASAAAGLAQTEDAPDPRLNYLKYKLIPNVTVLSPEPFVHTGRQVSPGLAVNSAEELLLLLPNLANMAKQPFVVVLEKNLPTELRAKIYMGVLSPKIFAQHNERETHLVMELPLQIYPTDPSVVVLRPANLNLKKLHPEDDVRASWVGSGWLQNFLAPTLKKKGFKEIRAYLIGLPGNEISRRSEAFFAKNGGWKLVELSIDRRYMSRSLGPESQPTPKTELPPNVIPLFVRKFSDGQRGAKKESKKEKMIAEAQTTSIRLLKEIRQQLKLKGQVSNNWGYPFVHTYVDKRLLDEGWYPSPFNQALEILEEMESSDRKAILSTLTFDGEYFLVDLKTNFNSTSEADLFYYLSWLKMKIKDIQQEKFPSTRIDVGRWYDDLQEKLIRLLVKANQTVSPALYTESEMRRRAHLYGLPLAQEHLIGFLNFYSIDDKEKYEIIHAYRQLGYPIFDENQLLPTSMSAKEAEGFNRATRFAQTFVEMPVNQIQVQYDKDSQKTTFRWNHQNEEFFLDYHPNGNFQARILDEKGRLLATPVLTGPNYFDHKGGAYYGAGMARNYALLNRAILQKYFSEDPKFVQFTGVWFVIGNRVFVKTDGELRPRAMTIDDLVECLIKFGLSAIKVDDQTIHLEEQPVKFDDKRAIILSAHAAIQKKFAGQRATLVSASLREMLVGVGQRLAVGARQDVAVSLSEIPALEDARVLTLARASRGKEVQAYAEDGTRLPLDRKKGASSEFQSQESAGQILAQHRAADKRPEASMPTGVADVCVHVDAFSGANQAIHETQVMQILRSLDERTGPYGSVTLVASQESKEWVERLLGSPRLIRQGHLFRVVDANDWQKNVPEGAAHLVTENYLKSFKAKIANPTTPLKWVTLRDVASDSKQVRLFAYRPILAVAEAVALLESLEIRDPHFRLACDMFKQISGFHSITDEEFLAYARGDLEIVKRFALSEYRLLDFVGALQIFQAVRRAVEQSA